MNSKIGRPTEAKKDGIIKVRADENLIGMLEYCVKITGESKSSVVRIAIEDFYNKLKGEHKK